MASNSASSHSFQKLKIDTSAGLRPAPSSNAPITREDSSHSSQNGLTQAQSSSECIPLEAQTANGTYAWREHRGSDVQKVPYDVVVGSSASSEENSDIAQFRQSTTSISLDNEVRLNTGDTLALEVSVPKSLSCRTHTPESGSYSDLEYLEMPYSERRSLQHRIGVPRYPLLQMTMASLAEDPEYNEQMASLTSETTASPPLEEARTPLETPTEYMLSPEAADSPEKFPSFFSQRNGPTSTRSYRSELDGSLRKASRRSSTRSGRSLSSASPAESFLARYKPSGAPLKQTEPDDEGQGIGYNSEYIIGKQIGYGGFSVVKEVTSIEDGKPVVNAVKIVRKQLQQKPKSKNEQMQTQFDHEVEIWRFLRHPYILPLLHVYTTDFATFCIMKLNKGGTLFDLVRETRRQKKTGLPKQLVKRYTYQLALALRYLHNDVKVVYRGAKLENCLVDMTVPNAERDGGDVLLCGFSMADSIVSDQRDGPEPHFIGNNQNISPADTTTLVVSSLQYAAPELFDAKGPVFSLAADIWAFGVILYTLLTASLPFNEGLDIKTTKKIREGSWDKEAIRNAEAVADGGIDDVLALLRGCLELDVERRWSIQDILQCPWLRECEDVELVTRKVEQAREIQPAREVESMKEVESTREVELTGELKSSQSLVAPGNEELVSNGGLILITAEELVVANDAAGEDELSRQVRLAKNVASARKDALTKKFNPAQEAHAAKEFHSIEDVERAKTIDAFKEASQYHTQESQFGMLPESKFTYQDVITSFFHESTEKRLGQSSLPLVIDWLIDRLLVRWQEPPVPRNRVRARWQCVRLI
jgi:serine/threonine protein kinase